MSEYRKNPCIGGTDQGFHNVLFYRGQLRSAISIPNGETVLTVGIYSKLGVSVAYDAEQSNILSDETRRRISPIVHQYDKYDHLLEMVHAKYLKDEFAALIDFKRAMTGGARYSAKGG